MYLWQMSRRKRYIENLTAEQKQELQQGYKYGSSHDFRLRCYSILLSNQGKSIPEIRDLFQVSLQSIYSWFNRWESDGIEGLKIRPGRGRKRKLDIDNTEHQKVVKQALKKENRSAKQLRQEIESQLGESISDSTMRNFLKDLVIDTEDFASASNPSRTHSRWLKK
jgi:transposase